MVRYTAFILAIAVAAPSCGAPIKTDGQRSDSAYKPVVEEPEKPVTNKITRVSERFPTLDHYLAFLERRAAIDGAWYREIRPGVYRRETGNYHGPAAEKQLFTREELARKFGFAE